MKMIVAKTYQVKFVNDYYDKDNALHEINFQAQDPEDIKAVIEALSSHYSGDPYRCYIDGVEALLHLDFGLV